MALASSNRAQLRYILESTYGTTPGAGNSNNLRMTGESLSFGTTTDTSKEIRTDRQVTDLILTGASANGGFNFELSYNEYDTLLAAMFSGTWSVYGTAGVGTTFTATYTATTLTAAVAPTTTSAFTTLAQGQWFRVNAPTGLNAGKWFRVHASTPPTSTIITLDPSTPASVESTIATTSVSTSRLTNGIIQTSYSMEAAFNDITQFFNFRGMTPNKLSLSLASGAIVTGSMDFLGKDSIRTASTQMPGSPVASRTYDVMNAVAGVGHVWEGGSPITGTFIKSLKFDLDNKLRGQTAIGTLGNAGIGVGTFDINGEMEVYLADGTLYDKFVNNTASAISWRMVDGAGNGYVLQFPKVKYKDAKVQAGGLDQDVMLTMPFQAIMDPTLSKTVVLDRFGAAIT